MRDGSDRLRASGGHGVPQQRQVQVARGHWHREEGTARSAGWWESVTVTWSPARGPGRGPSRLHRALATAVDTIAPSVVELAAAAALRLLERRARQVLPARSRPGLPYASRQLPPPDRSS